MPWQPKTGSPATFRLRDEFLTLITGDASWSWLVDWLPTLPGDPVDTAAFCAAGPHPAPDLSPILGASPPDRNPFSVLAKTATLGVAVGMAANDRVFQALCENADVLVAGWATPTLMPFNSVPGGAQLPRLAVPAGATQLRWAMHDYTGDLTTGGPIQGYLMDAATGGSVVTGLQSCPVGPGTLADSWTYACTAGQYVQVNAYGPAATGTMSVEFNVIGAPTDYTPTPQPPITGMPALPTTGADLASIAHELDLQEAKLDFLTSLLQMVLRIDPGFPDAGADAPTDVVADVPSDIGTAVGFIFTVSGVPSGLDVGFGTPQQVDRLGRVTFGTATAWYPSIPLTHSPMVLRPLPPGTTRYSVSDLPPMVTCTVAAIQPAK